MLTGSLARDARRAVSKVLKTLPVTRVTTLAEQIDSALVPDRLMATLSGFFGLLGAVLPGIGAIRVAGLHRREVDE